MNEELVLRLQLLDVLSQRGMQRCDTMYHWLVSQRQGYYAQRYNGLSERFLELRERVWDIIFPLSLGLDPELLLAAEEGGYADELRQAKLAELQRRGLDIYAA